MAELVCHLEEEAEVLMIAITHHLHLVAEIMTGIIATITVYHPHLLPITMETVI